jgi:uncharacterized ParB-like nuclease family protein
MSEATDPQPVDTPTNTGGGSAPTTTCELDESDESMASDPPTNTGGGGTS